MILFRRTPRSSTATALVSVEARDTLAHERLDATGRQYADLAKRQTSTAGLVERLLSRFPPGWLEAQQAEINRLRGVAQRAGADAITVAVDVRELREKLDVLDVLARPTEGDDAIDERLREIEERLVTDATLSSRVARIEKAYPPPAIGALQEIRDQLEAVDHKLVILSDEIDRVATSTGADTVEFPDVLAGPVEQEAGDDLRALSSRMRRLVKRSSYPSASTVKRWANELDAIANTLQGETR